MEDIDDDLLDFSQIDFLEKLRERNGSPQKKMAESSRKHFQTPPVKRRKLGANCMAANAYRGENFFNNPPIDWHREVEKNPFVIFSIPESVISAELWLTAIKCNGLLFPFFPEKFYTRDCEKYKVQIGKRIINSSSLLVERERNDIDKALYRFGEFYIFSSESDSSETEEDTEDEETSSSKMES